MSAPEMKIMPVAQCGLVGKCQSHPSGYEHACGGGYSKPSIERVATYALQQLESARAKDVATHEENLPAIENNKAVRAHVAQLMTGIGMPPKWSELDRNSRSRYPKTVTRRLGWLNLRPGQQVRPVRKCMGLRPGEKLDILRDPLTIVAVRREPLRAMLDNMEYGLLECALEGFAWHPDYKWPSSFVGMFCASHKGCTPDTVITRIEFSYHGDPENLPVRPRADEWPFPVSTVYPRGSTA